MNTTKTIKCDCGNTLGEYTSFDNNDNLIEDGYSGYKCTNCNHVHIKKDRTPKTIYRAVAFNCLTDLEIPVFYRMTLKKAKQLKALEDFHCVVECNTNIRYYVFISEFDNKVELVRV